MPRTDGYVNDAEYLSEVEGTCGHYKDDARECEGCEVTSCCVQDFDCELMSYNPALCPDCTPRHPFCPSCDPDSYSDR